MAAPISSAAMRFPALDEADESFAPRPPDEHGLRRTEVRERPGFILLRLPDQWSCSEFLHEGNQYPSQYTRSQRRGQQTRVRVNMREFP